MDSDAAAYISAVETADGASLASYIATAIDDFVIGVKADGDWAAIKAACLLAGPATIAGALTPLVGAAPTNNGLTDYDTELGVKNNSTHYLNTNRNSNADGQNNNHRCVYLTETGTIDGVVGHMGTSVANTGSSNVGYSSSDLDGVFFRNNSSASTLSGSDNRSGLGLWGTSRAASGSFTRRYKQATATASITSQTPESANHLIFWRGAGNYSTARIAWYSVGDALDLSALEARLATYLAALVAGPTGAIQTRRRRDLGGYGL